MQVLENAVRKLKMPSPVEDHPTRIEPSFEKTTPAEGYTTMSPEPEVSVEPVPIPVVRAASSPPPRPEGPLFSDLPEPTFEDDAPRKRDTGGSGGGGEGPEDDDDERRFGPWLTWFGAAASVALVIGVSVWTYKLGQRDAREVPIVAALEGPARVAPDDTGGLQVAHQGHSVNTVLEGRGVEQVAQSVTIAPRDNDLTEEDAPSSELTALVASRAPTARPATDAADAETDAVAEVQPLTPNGTVVTPTTTESSNETEVAAAAADATEAEALVVPEAAAAPQTEIAAVEAPRAPETVADPIVTPADEIAALQPDVAPIEAPTEVADAPTSEAAEPVVEPQELEVAALGPLPPVGEGSVFAPAMMKLPAKRPENLNVAMANAVNAALETVLAEATPSPAATPAPAPEPQATQVASNDLDVIPLPGGTRMIQLGAYGSEAIARQQWDRLSSQHGDLLAAKDHYVQRTNNSGKVFYRLRVAGYESKSDTKSACAALSARGLPCITVTLK